MRPMPAGRSLMNDRTQESCSLTVGTSWSLSNLSELIRVCRFNTSTFEKTFGFCLLDARSVLRSMVTEELHMLQKVVSENFEF